MCWAVRPASRDSLVTSRFMLPTNDTELERYRTLLEPQTEFKSGFGWTTVVGILFCGLIMLPGGIYLGLMTGNNIGAAAQWVTVILFMEIARRSLQAVQPAESGRTPPGSVRDDGGLALFRAAPWARWFSALIWSAAMPCVTPACWVLSRMVRPGL